MVGGCFLVDGAVSPAAWTALPRLPATGTRPLAAAAKGTSATTGIAAAAEAAVGTVTAPGVAATVARPRAAASCRATSNILGGVYLAAAADDA